MQDLNCLIVEDEHLAARIVSDYIAQIPGLKLEAVCGDVISANTILQASQIDLIFLDINLPGISGIEFIQTLNRNYDIILTTAYHQYAVEGFNLNVVDYLLKPIEFSRFLKAVNKVMEKRSRITSNYTQKNVPSKTYFFNTGRRQEKVLEENIRYIESLKDYVRIHTTTGDLVTKYQIGQIENMLGNDLFLRIHKSFIINKTMITAFTASEIELQEVSLPIGRTYKELVDRELTRLKSGEG